MNPATRLQKTSDVQLMRKFYAQRDAQALGIVLDRHRPLMEHKAASCLQKRTAALAYCADVVQNVAVKVLRQRGKPWDASRGSVAAWLVMLTKYEALNVKRRLPKASLISQLGGNQSGGDWEMLGPQQSLVALTNPAGRLEVEEELRLANALLARLNAQSRQIVELRYCDGKSGREIAQQMHVSEATVCRRLAEFTDLCAMQRRTRGSDAASSQGRSRLALGA